MPNPAGFGIGHATFDRFGPGGVILRWVGVKRRAIVRRSYLRYDSEHGRGAKQMLDGLQLRRPLVSHRKVVKGLCLFASVRTPLRRYALACDPSTSFARRYWLQESSTIVPIDAHTHVETQQT